MEYPQSVTVSLFAGGTIAVGTANAIALKVPADAIGGALTVKEGWICSRVAINAGSIPMFDLVTLNSGGTVTGTIANSSTAVFTSGTAKALTVTQTECEPGTYIAWKVMGTAVNADPSFITAGFTYVPGY